MNKLRMVSLCVTPLIAAFAVYNLCVENMPQIRFEIGRNIHETAKYSGAPKYSTRNIDGLISYMLVDLPSDIPAVYDVAGYQITALPLFAFTLYADRASNNDLAVEAASLQFSTDEIKSHEEAQAFGEQLISQFHQGQWKRHVPELCPAVAGRSSFLDETGKVDQIWACPLDSYYRLPKNDWIKLMATTQNFQWLGANVLATLTVGFSDDLRGLTYSIHLDFDNLAIKSRRSEENERRNLMEGDAEGWNSSARHERDIENAKARIATLEKNAVKRGDALIPRQ